MARSQLDYLSEYIRKYRSEKAVSLDDLAKKSGLSRAAINQIETGKSVPNVLTLSKLAHAMQTTLTELVAPLDQATPFKKVHQKATERRLSKDGSFESYPLTSAFGDRKTELFSFSFRKAGSHVAIRPQGTVGYVYVQSGSMKLETGGHTEELGAGDIVQFRPVGNYTYLQESKDLASGVIVLRYL